MEDIRSYHSEKESPKKSNANNKKKLKKRSKTPLEIYEGQKKKVSCHGCSMIKVVSGNQLFDESCINEVFMRNNKS